MSTDDFPDNDTTTGLLVNGGQVWGELETEGDIDWFRLALDAEHAYRFTARTADGTEPFIYIIDAADPWWPKFTNMDGLLSSNELANPFAFAEPGHQYYLRVENPTATSYVIGMTAAADDYGNSSASARALAVGGTVDAYLDYSFDQEHYSIAATAGLTYKITVTADAMGTDGWLRAYSDAARYTSWSGYAESGRGQKSLTMSFLATETRVYDVTVTMPSYSPPAAPVHYRVSASAMDATAPTVVSATSTFDGPLHITFNEAIRLGSGTIALNGTTWDIGSAAVSIQGNTLTLDSGLNLLPHKQYSIAFSAGAVTDLAGNHAEYGYSASATVKGASHGNLVGSRDTYWLGDTIQGTDGTFDSVVYQGSPGDYTFKIVNGNVDVANAHAEHDLLVNIERVYFENSTDVMGFSLNGDLGQVYRLYRAAFDRTPDKGGLGFWVGLRDDGIALYTIANEFIHSKEFTDLYGANTTNAAFVDELYENILDRPGDDGGVAYWNAILDQGADRANMLIVFSESAENQQGALETLGNGFTYTPYG